jgi:hypothetical protein
MGQSIGCNGKIVMNRLGTALLALLIFIFGTVVPSVHAHHVLGRPSYSLNEDSNTPPTMQVETQIGEYFVSLTAFPAFPRVGELTVIKISASHLDSDATFNGNVHFQVRDDVWFGGATEDVGIQETPIDGIYSQAVVFQEEGDYIVTAAFEANGAPYRIDFPVRIGNPPPVLPLALAGGALALILIGVPILKRMRKRRLIQPRTASSSPKTAASPTPPES